MSRVFIFGAGSSKAVLPKAPLNDQLLGLALGLQPDRRINLVKQFLQDFFQFDPNAYPQNMTRLPSLEDILSQLDSCLLDKRPLSSDYPLARLTELRESLVYAICRVLRQSLRSGELRLMTKLIRLLGPQDTLISLNYDLIVDNSLLHNSKTADYGFPIRQVLNSHILYDHRGEVYVKLYKLHGSLNWLYCPACRRVDLTPGVKGVMDIFQDGELRDCSVCHVRYEPMIITPTFLKNYDNHYIGRIWLEAETALQQADEIVFIGYSLPDADIILRTMFTRAIYRNRLLNGQTPHVTVVDLNEAAQNPTRTRYERVFGDVSYSNEGFKHYLQHLINQ